MPDQSRNGKAIRFVLSCLLKTCFPNILPDPDCLFLRVNRRCFQVLSPCPSAKAAHQILAVDSLRSVACRPNENSPQVRGCLLYQIVFRILS